MTLLAVIYFYFINLMTITVAAFNITHPCYWSDCGVVLILILEPSSPCELFSCRRCSQHDGETVSNHRPEHDKSGNKANKNVYLNVLEFNKLIEFHTWFLVGVFLADRFPLLPIFELEDFNGFLSLK